jgi:(p)ppGpp synthase/HD superfamily hydrolase
VVSQSCQGLEDLTESENDNIKNPNMPDTNFCPYLHCSLKLVAKPRRGGGNMFRHQMETLAILFEYGHTNPVLLKAALIHDIIEDGDVIGFHTFDEIKDIDEDGGSVLALVKEVSQHMNQGKKEPKSEFLLRIMQQGSQQARILKLADRISNLCALPLTRDPEFISSYLRETELYIQPYAENINTDMASELKNRIESIKTNIQL